MSPDSSGAHTLSPTAPAGRTPLRRSVTTWGLFLFILGDVLGAGVCVLAGSIAGLSGGAVWAPLVAALLLALLTAGSAHYATRAFGPFGGFLVGFCMLSAGLVSVVALVAVANGALLTGIMTSRITYGMARDGLLPGVLGKVLPGRRTPWVAIVVTTLISLTLALTGALEVLAGAMVLLLLVVFIAVNVAVLVLRRDAVAHRHYRVPVVLPVAGVASCLLLLTQVEAETWALGLPFLGGAAVLAGIAAWRRRGRPVEDGQDVRHDAEPA